MCILSLLSEDVESDINQCVMCAAIYQLSTILGSIHFVAARMKIEDCILIARKMSRIYKALFIYLCAHHNMHTTINALSIESTRREMVSRSLTSGGVISTFGWAISPSDVTAAAMLDDDDKAASFSSYQIIPDDSPKLDPTLQQITPLNLNQILAMADNKVNGGALWLGEHHNSAIDHQLQSDFIRKIHNQRQTKLGQKDGNMAVGLEQVQVQFQPILDAYINKEISSDELYTKVEWEKRWSWSYENYLPIFRACRELNIPLIALNVDTEDLKLVESGGFPNLSREQLQKYISDPEGFAKFATNPYYKTYVDYVISPSYDFHRDMGIIGDMSFISFFSGRILWDEAMANNAYKWNKKNEVGLMIGLVGADHAKFQGGITGRYQRLAKKEAAANGQQLNCLSVILNPTLIDTRPSGSVSMESNTASAGSKIGNNGLSLQLRYLKKGIDVGSPESRESSATGGVLPLADYLVLSKS